MEEAQIAPSGVEGSLRLYGPLRWMRQTSVTGVLDILGEWFHGGFANCSDGESM